MSELEQNTDQQAVENSGNTECNCGCNEKENQKKPCACKKIRKVVLWVLGVLVAVIALLLIFRDFYIPAVVSKAGTYALGTKVELKKFSSSLTGKIDIQGLSVANPEGYNNPNAFVLERVFVDISIPSLFSNEIIVHEILVTGMQVDLEAKLNRTNLTDLQKNIESKLPAKSDKPAEKQEVSETDSAKPQKSVVIEKLDINNNYISFSNATLHLTTKIPLVPISLKDIGRGQSIAETVNEILIRVLTSVFDACSSVGGALSNSLKDAGSALSDSAGKLGKGLSDAAGKLGDDLSKSTKDLGKGLSDSANKLFRNFK